MIALQPPHSANTQNDLAIVMIAERDRAALASYLADPFQAIGKQQQSGGVHDSAIV
jgi:hypothetical protein